MTIFNVKTLLITATVLLAATSTNIFANSNFTGVYAGAVIGYSYDPMNFVSKPVEFITTTERDYHLSGITGGVELGYGTVVKNNYYLGLDFLGLLSNVNSAETFSATSSSQRLDFKQKNHYGVDLHAGYILRDDALLYAIVGYSEASFNAKERNVIGASFDTTNEKNATLSGLDLGLGAKISISDHIFLDVKYLYTNYNSFSQLVWDSASSSKNDKYSPKAHLLTLGILYKF
ncbi:MAG: outer membrane beta-barrel protein [Gammaproteobacteria bacterium]